MSEDWIEKRKEEMEEKSMRAIYECLLCGKQISLLSTAKPKGKCPECKAESWKLKYIDRYTKKQYEEALRFFKDKNLLEHINKEISKSHIGDDSLKMTAFLTAISGLLKNQKLRKSLALTGDSSLGKDNLIKSVLKQMPLDSFIFLTSGTQSTLEDDIADKRIIAFSEMNANRENGANKFLVEVIKQKTEGGTSAIKKDIRTGMKTARHEVGEQGTVFFNTTESEKDEELQTRYITGSLLLDEARIQQVNKNTTEIFSNKDKLLKDSQEEDNWVRIGLTKFFKNEEQYEVLIPYAPLLNGKIEEKIIYDSSNPRSQRDLKRLLSLVCATTYLFQEQREVQEYQGNKMLIAKIEDLIETLRYSQEFFNQSYSGLDARLNKVLELVQEQNGAWIDKKLLQEKANIRSRHTINAYCSVLAEEGFIEGAKGVHLNEETGVKLYDGNRIYYKSVQKACKKPFISVQLDKLKEYLEINYNQENARLTSESVQNKACILSQGNEEVEKEAISVKKEAISEQNAHFEMHAFEETPNFDELKAQYEAEGLL